MSVSTKYSRSLLSWALITAIVLRGVIPLGYMPDVPRAESAFPGIRICGGHAHKPGDTQNKADAPCSFSVNAAFSFAGVGAPEFSTLIVFFSVLLIAAGFMLAPQRVYGNASSRAPPSLS